MYLLGYDIGSSSLKAALVDAETGEVVATASHPETEMEMLSLQSGWAEQLPEVWWQNLCIVTKKLLEKSGVNAADLGAIGIGYQMHGLVTVDKDGKAIRPAIIWCDSRAVDIGEQAFREIGPDYCLQHYLNSPGNFTASKLKWVKDNEPALYEQIKYFMLPGDYIAYRLTGEAMTTVSGLSEGILWDFAANDVSTRLLDHYGIDRALAPPVAPTFGLQGRLGTAAAAELGLKAGVPVAYRAGDQPNNALSLGALNPGEVAATGGTSGVVYGVTDRLAGDPLQRVNSFAHVNHRPEQPRVGVLLCINGSGILYGWMRKQVANGDISYGDMEQIAATAPVGADGLRILPFGNGAERMFGNRNTGASILNLHFNRHRQAHLYRASLEGIAFSFIYGVQGLKDLGLETSLVRAGNDNLFQSKIFSATIANLLGCRIEIMATTGAVGAAIAAGAGIGYWSDVREGLSALRCLEVFEPEKDRDMYREAYEHWAEHLEKTISQ